MTIEVCILLLAVILSGLLIAVAIKDFSRSGEMGRMAGSKGVSFWRNPPEEKLDTLPGMTGSRAEVKNLWYLVTDYGIRVRVYEYRSKSGTNRRWRDQKLMACIDGKSLDIGNFRMQPRYKGRLLQAVIDYYGMPEIETIQTGDARLDKKYELTGNPAMERIFSPGIRDIIANNDWAMLEGLGDILTIILHRGPPTLIGGKSAEDVSEFADDVMKISSLLPRVQSW